MYCNVSPQLSHSSAPGKNGHIDAITYSLLKTAPGTSPEDNRGAMFLDTPSEPMPPRLARPHPRLRTGKLTELSTSEVTSVKPDGPTGHGLAAAGHRPAKKGA